MKLGNKLTESKDIAKTIGFFLKEKGKNFGLKQETWAEKISKNEGKEMTQGNLNSYLNGIRTSPDLEVYWTFAKAIPLTRKEFDQIVEDAKRKVLGVGGGGGSEKDPDETIKMALNSKGWTQPEINEMMNFIKFKETNK